MLLAPLRVAAVGTEIAAGTALLGGNVAMSMGRSLVRATPDVPALTRAAAGAVLEAAGGPPARRTSSNGARHWIEVRGLESAQAAAIATDVLAAVRATPGVRQAYLNRTLARVVVTVADGGPSASELSRTVAGAERRRAGRQLPASLPGDDALLMGRMVAATAASVGLGLSLTGSLLRLPRLPDLVAVPPTVADHLPRLRRELERRLGPDGTDVLFGIVNATAAALTLSPTAAAAEAATRTMLAAEAWNGRLAWSRHEPGLAGRPVADDAGAAPIANPAPPDGPAERYANRIGMAGLGAAAAVGLLTRNPDAAGAAALAAMPKPLRTVREAFGCTMNRGLSTRHDALVLRPRVLRTLDRIDAIMVDPRALYTDELTVSRVLGVDNSARAHAWEAVRAALDNDGLKPGWHPLTDIPGAGSVGEALISPVRNPFAAAVLTEARRSQPRVYSLDDDGLRSLAQGFDQLYPADGSIDHAVAAAVAELKAAGNTVALLTTSDMRAAHRSDVTIGLLRPGHSPPWGADVIAQDLTGAWRLLHALPAARAATDNAVRLSASASAIGALMLIPGVPGRSSASVNVGMFASLWFGYRAAVKTLRDPLPEPETSHDWHALPVAEVQRLLPRPTEEDREETAAWWQQVPPVRALHDASVASWGVVRDFAEEMRGDLADPITPLLATGAAASALLGSPLDAVLVGSVLLVNAALSAEQQLHAESTLNRLLAVQDPPARRRVGALDAHRREKVPTKRLRLGDIIEVHVDEVVPADARLLHASNVEVDESTLTGESLPVAKQTDPTPGAPLAERTCMLYAGTTVVAGTAVAVVTAVGSQSEMRRALAMAPRKMQEIGLQRQLRHITRRALPFSVAGGGLVGLLSMARGTGLREAVSSAVTLIVAAIPEGLPLVATLAQLAAARRLTGESVLIRNPHSVEALARLNVVCFDKTGTLSENRLKVKAVRPMTGYTPGALLDAALSTSYARHTHRVDHATDDAIHRAAEDPALRGDGSGPQRLTRDAFLPFQSGRPFAAALVGTRLTIKGSPEVLASALLHDDHPLTQQVDEMAANGLRVLAVAERQLSASEAASAAKDPDRLEALCGSGLTPVGLLGLADTPRAAAPAVLKELGERGIGVRLITGDHPATAAAIAQELGIDVTADQVITGSDWEALSADQRADAAASRVVFARMTPEHKIAVVQTLERSGLVTAMVGDGVNDAAAIRAASVGIGVAARGSDAARTAADVVLLDERIEALLDALDEGEQLWRRVQSAVSMLLGGNLGEVCFALLTTVLTGRSVLNARQMLLVNMLTDALPAAALAVSPQTGTADVDRDEAAMWRAIGIRGAATTIGATAGWAMAGVTGPPRRAATVALVALVGAQLTQTLVDSRAPLVVLTSVGSLGALAVVVSTPGLSQLFGCTPLDPLAWGQGLLAAAAASGLSAVAPDLLLRASQGAQRRWLGVEPATEPERAQSPTPSVRPTLPGPGRADHD
ncbi:cation-translocating P-type ATPase [Mycobacterium sp. 852002-30065_SCH5024008]|uniref:cation-translocating P-type ATPase n=1 Tax=Mycobacterium sp. 852002-30065_SCH5024008 TaxID=1834088 RepID=UPI0007FF1AA3|nr:cation-translocating P-type ATPase [Mycobacterium sp. 852002-30065_SCH5024008]OBB91577.1 haloacid dehalogenase [Mycobacterium sp. 852002-30065_SCH5024008]